MWLTTGSIVRGSREAGSTPLSCRLPHSDPKTTRLYDRRSDAVTMDEVERIGI
jgi:hypothetical protein